MLAKILDDRIYTVTNEYVLKSAEYSKGKVCWKRANKYMTEKAVLTFDFSYISELQYAIFAIIIIYMT